MSFTNIITEGNVTIVQGVNGIRLCQESWMKQAGKGKKAHSKPFTCASERIDSQKDK